MIHVPNVSEKRAARTRLRKFVNRVSIRRAKFARIVHCCCLCMTPIEKGEEYRDGGPGQRAHEFCFDALTRELK